MTRTMERSSRYGKTASAGVAGLSEIAAGLFSVLGVAVYYFAVYLFRDHLTEGYEFFIRR